MTMILKEHHNQLDSYRPIDNSRHHAFNALMHDNCVEEVNFGFETFKKTCLWTLHQSERWLNNEVSDSVFYICT